MRMEIYPTLPSCERSAHERPLVGRSRELSYAVSAMADVVNLNKFRKRKAKAEREQRAETNRRLHGRTKQERERDALQKKQLTAKLDGKKLSKPDPDSQDD